MGNGIDVSVLQGAIAWDKVKKAGIDFVMIKASQGQSETNKAVRNFADAKFTQNITGAARAGIRGIGVYHYLTATNEAECDAEAEYFLSVIAPYKHLISGYVAVDVESKYLPTDRERLTAIVKRFVSILSGVGYRVMVYTNPSFLRYRLADEIRRYPLWLAWYVNAAKSTVKELYPTAVYWQCGLKRIDGISGDVDFDVSLDTAAVKAVTEDTAEKKVYRIGDTYTVKADDVYTNGKVVPKSIVGRVCTVQRVASGKILLKEILSWVKI